MTPEQKAELRRLADDATPGPWKYENDGTIGGILVRPPTGRPHRHDSLADAQFIAAANPQTVIDLLDQLDRAEAECAELQSRLHGAEAANAAVNATLVDHVELNGHLEVAEQCHDYLAAEVCRDGDPTGRLRDFVASLYVVIDQFDRQRRSRNWYEVAYTAGKQKLIEHALSKVCCNGEPHTCEQEAIAAAEGRTDRTIEQLSACRAALAEACDIAAMSLNHMDRNAETKANRITALRAEGGGK